MVRKEQVERYVQHYKRLLRLSDWDHSITMGRGKPEEVASVITNTGGRVFYLTFNPRKFADPDICEDKFYSLETVIIHELLHVMFAPVYYATAIEAELEVKTFQVIQKNLEEPMVDTLARVLARFLPRPR